MITPHPYQADAVEKTVTALTKLGRALVVMATGLGKTIVGALAIKDLLKSGRGLFLCHLNTGLEQAQKQFRETLGEEVRLGVFHGEKKHWDEVDILFASFQTFTIWKHAFFENEFRFIIVDESHHSQAPTFKDVIRYFRPTELLALTATPDRMDQKDIREIFGQEVVNITLEEGLAKGWLAEVEYHLITDNLNRFELKEIAHNVLRQGKKISMKQLNETLFIEARDEKVAETILCYGNKKTIVFCENVRHADNFQKFLPGSKAYHSGIDSKENHDTLERFRSGECRCLLVVDKMNECIDIPDAELIVFFRCTDSKTIFLQQLGRGLRKTLEKRKVVVLDFVANADRVMMIREMVKRVEGFTPNWTELEQDPHYVKGNAFNFIFTDEQIDLFEVLKRLQPRYISDVPELLTEYSDKNPLPASQVFTVTRNQVIWRCSKCKHEWRAEARERSERNKTGCPACHGQVATPERNLLNLFPLIAAEYSEKNTTPVTEVMPFSGKRYLWKCSHCSNEWQTDPGNRTRHGTGCPKCRGKNKLPKAPKSTRSIVRQRHNLATHPELARRYSDRNQMPISKVSLGSHKKCWWKCPKCFHEWESSPRNRSRLGIICPKCHE